VTSDERLRLEFTTWAKAGRGEGMEKGHRPVGEQAIELMTIPRNARPRARYWLRNGWATRLLAQKARDAGCRHHIADEMVRIARDSPRHSQTSSYRIAQREPIFSFGDGGVYDAFSMESLYYYHEHNGGTTPKSNRRWGRCGFLCGVDLYQENVPSHQWVETVESAVHF